MECVARAKSGRRARRSVLLAFPLLLGLFLRLETHLLDLDVEVGLYVISLASKTWKPIHEGERWTYPSEELHEVEERHPQFGRQELLREDGVHGRRHPCDLRERNVNIVRGGRY